MRGMCEDRITVLRAEKVTGRTHLREIQDRERTS